MSNQSFYYAIRVADDGLGPCWYYSHGTECLQSTCATLPQKVFKTRDDAEKNLEKFKKDFPKLSDGAKIVLIGINYNI